MEQVEALERAIRQRAHHLAAEYRERAERSRDNILQEAHKRLHLREEREVLVAKSQAERTYRRQVQSSELKMQKEMDLLRWNLVMAVRKQLRGRLKRLLDDDERYISLLQSLLSQAAQHFEEPTLVASVNARDQNHLRPVWSSFSQAAGNKEIILSDESIDVLGGVVVCTVSGEICIDNSFEGREERLSERINLLILERLCPVGSLHNQLSAIP